MQRETFHIRELDCAEESHLLQKALEKESGIKRLDFDVLNRQMIVTYDATVTDSEKILNMIRSTGMTPSLSLQKEKKWGRFILCLCSGFFLLCGLIFHHRIFYLLAIVSGGWYVAPRAWASAKHLSFDMNLLMAIAVFGAIAIGQSSEGATVTFLFSVALMLESWSVERARRAISKLLDLSPTLARVMEEGGVIEKKVEDVAIGDRILVRPGEKIPVDGTVLSGSSSVNQAPITGEAVPSIKQPGDPVFAGTINDEGALEIKVTREANDTTLSRIIQMVQEARTKRAKSEQWVDQFSKIYTPCMLLLALGLAIIPPLFAKGDWLEWIYQGLVMLVIACPCALVISTPVSIVSALTAAARTGVLIKGGIFLEVMGKIEAIAFDKTGTVTLGRPKLQRIVPFSGHNEKELLEIAVQLEMGSEHPLARAIIEKAALEKLPMMPAENFQAFKGLGAEGTINRKRYWIGSHRFMHEQGRQESNEAHAKALELEDAGHSVVAIGDFTHICGLMSFADESRPNISETIMAIKELGIKKVVMLTGDNQKTAASLADQVGIEDFFAELLPENKVEEIEKLKKQHTTVAMVGDGVNDAPALAASSCAIAMGAIGSDAAFETADIVLMKDDLGKIPWLIRHARRALAIVKQNITFALGVKAIFIILAGFELATLWMAIAADTGASLLVVFNGLRLLSWKSTEN
ncbi:MAG: cadmium-translocating P-type ATPase [Verrucomicrobia bacterium]|nr:cadmium-translocating P-type ATPase [Verrucomicrobiota bacterium]